MGDQALLKSADIQASHLKRNFKAPVIQRVGLTSGQGVHVLTTSSAHIVLIIQSPSRTRQLHTLSFDRSVPKPQTCGLSSATARPGCSTWSVSVHSVLFWVRLCHSSLEHSMLITKVALQPGINLSSALSKRVAGLLGFSLLRCVLGCRDRASVRLSMIDMIFGSIVVVVGPWSLSVTTRTSDQSSKIVSSDHPVDGYSCEIA